nr:DUF2382 domain-containing protein [Nitrosopumilus sp.]
SQIAEKDARIIDDLVIVPVMAERLDVTKKVSSQEVKIIKESVTEIKAVEVPLAHDELYIETRPMGDKNEQQASELSVQSDNPAEEEIVTLFLRAEIPEVLKHSSLKEEIVVKKKISTETKKISEQLRSEQVSVEGALEEVGKEGKISE